MALWTSLRDSFIILSLSAAREKVSELQPAIPSCPLFLHNLASCDHLPNSAVPHKVFAQLLLELRPK